jgi:hypothetical protein
MSWQTIRTLTTQAAEAGVPAPSLFVAHPEAGQYATASGRIPYAEIGFDFLALTGSPTAVTLAVWRLSDATVERILTTTIQAADVAAPIPLDVEVDAEALWVTVDSFLGGSGPTLSGVVRFRPSRSGATRGFIDRLRLGQTGVFTNLANTLNVVPVVRYTATRPTLTDGLAAELQANTRGDLSVAETYAPQAEDNTYQVIATSRRFIAAGAYSPTKLVADFGATVTKNAKASAGVVTAIIGDNANAAVRYLQIHNTATTPSAGAVPLISFRVATMTSILIGEDVLSENGLYCSTGIAYAWSTTAGTYTAATAADHNTQVWGV